MKKGLIALSPLVVFIVLYLVTSIIARDFYKVPITVAFMTASIYAIIVFNGRPLRERIDVFSRGAGTSQMMLMLWIFVLAGAFANSAKTMGSIWHQRRNHCGTDPHSGWHCPTDWHLHTAHDGCRGGWLVLRR